MINPFDPGYYHEHELREFGFKSVGNNVRVAKNCTIIGLEHISLGDHVRIDGYSTLVAAGGFITLGNYIHVGGYAMLSGGAGIVMEDFSGLSQGVRLYSKSDDYSGASLTNPTVPARFLAVKQGVVTLARHVIVGSGSIVLPGVTIGTGSAVGALSVVSRSLDAWGVFAGVPARRIKARSQALLEQEAELLAGG